jgi:hypothetical protein
MGESGNSILPHFMRELLSPAGGWRPGAGEYVDGWLKSTSGGAIGPDGAGLNPF